MLLSLRGRLSRIEWFLVIAIAGVLIAIFFLYRELTIRSKDVKRAADVMTLYDAIQEWNTKTQIPQGITSYPLGSKEGGNRWQQELISEGVLPSVIVAPTNYRGTCTYNASSTNDSGYCVSNNGASPGKIMVWALIESKIETLKAGGACSLDPFRNHAVVFVASDQGEKPLLYCIGSDTANTPPWKTEL